MVANGSTFETEAEPKRLEPQAPFLFWNGGDFFHDLAPFEPRLAQPRVARGLAASDYDRDGDLDLLFVHHDGGLCLLRNEMQTGHWIELRLRSRPARPLGPWGHAEGATVIAEVGEIMLRRSVSSASYLSQSSHTLHFGLGAATRVDGLEVRWPDGERQRFESLESGALWELDQGKAEPRRVEPRPRLDERERVTAFWEAHRAGMRAMRRDGDVPRAVELFRRALALDPTHEDARYYLANGLALLGRSDEALNELETLIGVNPSSHRALKQWGTLRALEARSPEELALAEDYLERARALNPEATGTLLALGEVALMRGRASVAEERLEWVCRTNPRAVGGFFLRAQLAWRAGDTQGAEQLLEQARQARGSGLETRGRHRRG